ncbi:MAG: PadR family transcriptional regulator [Actinomycetota bacterium]|nr:PadR family transcriptional regulator [Actinomycetota bacterium]
MHKTQRGRRRHSAHGGYEMRSGHGPRGHRRKRGDVRSAILTLLGERGMHGYEMIQELEERTGGRWRPSAGSIYPTLQLLEDEGLVTAAEVEGRKVYSLTDAGTKAVAEIGDRKRPWENGDPDSPHHKLRTEAFRLRGALMQIGQAGDEGQVAKAVEILTDTRRRLYAILAEE